MAVRGRRTSRPSGDQRQEAILATAETLLGERGFDDISIEDLARGAGISRPAFYFYFSSREDVLLALLDRVIAQVERRVGHLSTQFAVEPEAAWRESIRAFVEVFAEHRAVAAAVMSVRQRSPAVDELWSRSMRTWIDYSTEVIRAERARGAAPAGVDAHDLAVSLNLMNERVLSAVFSGESPALDQEDALDVLVVIWFRSIYGTTEETSS